LVANTMVIASTFFYLLFAMVSQVGNTACRDVCIDLEIERGDPDRESALLVNVFGWQGKEML